MKGLVGHSSRSISFCLIFVTMKNGKNDACKSFSSILPLGQPGYLTNARRNVFTEGCVDFCGRDLKPLGTERYIRYWPPAFAGFK